MYLKIQNKDSETKIIFNEYIINNIINIIISNS